MKIQHSPVSFRKREEMKNKANYQQMLLRMIEPLKTRYREDCTGLRLGVTAAGYGNRIAEMEGFSRVLWGMVSYWAGGGKDRSLVDTYLKGFTAGTDPKGRNYWGDLHDKDQRMVEMAAISYGLLMIPDILWNPLDAETKDNLAGWLYQINDYSQADNNWQYFKVIVNLALKSIGRKWSREQIKNAMDRYESFYLGNGWYSDGKRPQKDYYTSFGIHFYCLLYAYFMREEDEKTARLFMERAKIFAQTFVYWFDDEGKALPFGRSLTYRFAQIAFFSVCVLTGVECFPLGVEKGLIDRNLLYWMHQPIFDNAGVLTVGYTYPNLIMSEAYNATGSPYWSFKAFVFLALPDDHPFWTAACEPLPELKRIYSVKECDMMLCHRIKEVIALTAGQYPTMNHPEAAEKYAKFAYSSVFGFCVPRSYQLLEQAGTDSMLAFYVHDMYYVRRKCTAFRITDGEVYAKWNPTCEIEVETWLIPFEGGHKRRHRIKSSLNCVAYDCGFSYPNCMEKTSKKEEQQIAEVSDQNGYSRISSDRGEGVVITALPNMNLIFPNVCIPAIRFNIVQGITEIETTIETVFTEKRITIGEGNCYEICDT